MLKENRERTFFGHYYTEDDVVCFILFEDMVIFAKNKSKYNYSLPDKKKYSRKYKGSVTHSTLRNDVFGENIDKFIKQPWSNGRLWLNTEQGFPIIALDDYRNEFVHSLHKLLHHFEIKDKIYVDKLSYFSERISNPNECLIPIKWINGFLTEHNLIEDYILYNMFSESKQVGLLYHATDSWTTTNEILRSNTLFSLYWGSSENKFNQKHNLKDYTSLTRNIYWIKERRKWDCIFVLDGDKLSQHYKIIPFFYMGNTLNVEKMPKSFYSNFKRQYNEYEERVKGHIKNLDKYLIKVIYNKNVWNGYVDKLKLEHPHINFEREKS